MKNIQPTHFGEIQAAVAVKPRYVVKCPHEGCDGEHDITHIVVGDLKGFGPWYCDSCGWAVIAKDVTVTSTQLTAMNGRKHDTLVLLAFEGLTTTGKPIYLVVKGMLFERDGVMREEGDKYYYEEQTCPSNYLKAFIMEGEDTDPHGIFRHIKTILKPANWDEERLNCEASYIHALFKHTPPADSRTMVAVPGGPAQPELSK